MNSARTRFEGLALVAVALVVTYMFIVMPMRAALGGAMDATVSIRPFLFTSMLLTYGTVYAVWGPKIAPILNDRSVNAKKLAIILPLLALAFILGLGAFFLVTGAVDAAMMAG